MYIRQMWVDFDRLAKLGDGPVRIPFLYLFVGHYLVHLR